VVSECSLNASMRLCTRASTGPIPPGQYRLFARTLSAPIPVHAVARTLWTRQDWGGIRIPAVPSMTTNTHGRGGFYLHGGLFPGSAGCIDVGGGLFGTSSTQQLINMIRLDPDGIVELTVVP
jgi:hypothetical protein